MAQLDTSRRTRELLHRCLVQSFGIESADFHGFIETNCDILDVKAGETLIRQGDDSTAVYFLLSGHMRALCDAEDGTRSSLGEIGRGEPVGELALFTGKPRSADVVATRDSIVAQLSASVLEAAIAREPTVAFRITKEILNRTARASGTHSASTAPTSITLLPVSPDMDAISLAHRMADRRRASGDRVTVMDAAYVRNHFGGLEEPDTAPTRGQVSRAIGATELEQDALIFVADPITPAWTQTAVHHSDEVVLLADARGQPHLSDLERSILERRSELSPRLTLVLVHEPDTRTPTGTAAWLNPRHVSRHVHIRRNDPRDERRLSRLLSGQAIGLVLSGGGANGLTHLGVLAALEVEGIEYDIVGGTGSGALTGLFAAMDVSGHELRDAARQAVLKAGKGNPSGDYNLVPYLSLSKGERLWSVVERAITDNAQGDVDTEDTWKTFFTIVSDVTLSQERVMRYGSLARNVVASASTPGLFPPVMLDGHRLHSGAIFNNFPVDHMRQLGANRIIGVDLTTDRTDRHDCAEPPTSLQAALDRACPGPNRYAFPSLPQTLLSATTIASMSRQIAMRDHVDLLLQPLAEDSSVTTWSKLNEAFEIGHSYTKNALSTADPDLIELFRASP